MTDELVDVVARAICDGFWEQAELPETWDTSSIGKQQVFRACARHAIAAARQFRAELEAARQRRAPAPPDLVAQSPASARSSAAELES